MVFKIRLLIIISVSLLSIGCDQTTKTVASEYLPKHAMNSYLGDIIRMGYTENTGAFLGLGNNLSENTRYALFVVLVGFFLGGLLVYMLSNSRLSRLSLISLSLVFSGGISNFYDRVINNGAVIDFINIGIGGLRTGIFNVADMEIMLGAALILFASYLHKDADKNL